MTAPISRRGVIAAPILLAGCRKRSEYFGNTAVPPRRSLKFALGPEPMASIRPASAAVSSCTSCLRFSRA